MAGVNMAGMQIGALTVLERAGATKNGNAKWKCRCGICGNEIILERKNILRRYGKNPDCGCLKRKRPKDKKADRKDPEKKNGHTLCWTCDLAGKSICAWDREFKPVSGWVAEEAKLWCSSSGQYEKSYRVISCPLFEH